MPLAGHESIIPEDEFRVLFSKRTSAFLEFTNLLLAKEPASWFKRHYSELVARAHETETFLDDFGARYNRHYAQLAELIACLRGFGKVAVALKHLRTRFERYRTCLSTEWSHGFLAETDRTEEFLDGSILALIRAIHQELPGLRIEVPSGVREDATVSEESARRQLPHDVDWQSAVEEDARVAEVASAYLDVAESFAWVAEMELGEETDLRTFVLQRLDEERSRDYEARVHSLQSRYDTYVGGTAQEKGSEAVAGLRGHATIALHLLEMGTELVHFYVRHENDIRVERVKERVAELVDKRQVLDRAVRYSFRSASFILTEGKVFAQESLRTFVKEREIELAVPDGEPLHARPISLIVKIVQHHGTRVEMSIGGEVCSAGSIMEMIMAVGQTPDARHVGFKGDERPLEDLRALFESGLGEAGLDSLPEQLAYLR